MPLGHWVYVIHPQEVLTLVNAFSLATRLEINIEIVIGIEIMRTGSRQVTRGPLFRGAIAKDLARAHLAARPLASRPLRHRFQLQAACDCRWRGGEDQPASCAAALGDLVAVGLRPRRALAHGGRSTRARGHAEAPGGDAHLACLWRLHVTPWPRGSRRERRRDDLAARAYRSP